MPFVRRPRWFWPLVLSFLMAAPPVLLAQGTLSQQVLQLLSRVNNWIGTNTFYDVRVPCTTIPGTTTARLYADGSCNLYFNGGLIAGSGGSVTPHNLLSTTHPDTLVASPTAGAVVVANSTPKWASLPGATGYLKSTGSATTFSTDGAAFTALPAGVLTGSLPAISGAALTGLNASNLASGSVPLARLTGITTTQLSGTAGVTYAQLALGGNVVNADIASGAAIAYSKLALTNSIAATDLTAASVTMAKIAQAGATSGQVITWSGSAWAPAAPSAGSVTSVALALPAIFTVSGSPVTATGTLTAVAASQTANRFWAAPNGSAGAPTFRAIVAADLPLSGVAAGTYPSVTVSTAGLVTAASATLNLATAGGATILPMANGGTGTAVAVDDTILIGSGTGWVGSPLPLCTRLLQYDTATNSFSCSATAALGTVTTSTPYTISETWNSGLVSFNGVLVAITDTSSISTSTIENWTVGGASKFSVIKDGTVSLAASRVYSVSTPTITAGFGTSPAITGRDSAFRVTQGTPVGATGTVTFGTAFTHAPVCTGVDETTTAGNPLKLTATTTTVAFASGGTMVAADSVAVSCIGY